MIRFLFFVSFCQGLSVAYAQPVEGYIINNDSDTLPVKIKVPTGIFGSVSTSSLYGHVKIIDSTGKGSKFSPSDIRQYAFSYKEKDYRFCSKPVANGSRMFLEAIVMGEKASLYRYEVRRHYTNSISTNEQFYTIERPGKDYLFFSSLGRLKKIKSSLKDYFSDIDDMGLFIDARFLTRQDIQEDIKSIIERANRTF